MSDPILVTLLKMQPHYSQSNLENAPPSSGTYPLASYKEVTSPPLLSPPPPPGGGFISTSLVFQQASEVFSQRNPGKVEAYNDKPICIGKWYAVWMCVWSTKMKFKKWLIFLLSTCVIRTI